MISANVIKEHHHHTPFCDIQADIFYLKLTCIISFMVYSVFVPECKLLKQIFLS